MGSGFQVEGESARHGVEAFRKNVLAKKGNQGLGLYPAWEPRLSGALKATLRALNLTQGAEGSHQSFLSRGVNQRLEF